MKDHILEIGFGRRGLDLGRVTNTTLSWGELIDRLSTPEIDDLDMSDYLALDKDARDIRKSVGFITGGPCVDGIRDAAHMFERHLVMLDCDDLSNRDIYECAKLGVLPGLDVEALVHSTRKSTEETPRLRVIIPLSRAVNHIEFVAVARLLAAKMDATMVSYDKASFSMAQIMYLPSVCRDVPYFAEHIQGAGLADPDAILAEFPDWTDLSTLPKKDDEKIRLRDPEDRAMDPREKRGVIGAFCRRFDIHAAIDEYLPDVYVRSSKRGMTDRYTRIGSEGANGALTYDDLFLYSHHGTDPAHGQLVNSFDLVRIHLFGDRDIGYEGPFKSAPSQKAMIALAMEDDLVREAVEAERALPRVTSSDFDDEDEEMAEPAMSRMPAKMEMTFEANETTSLAAADVDDFDKLLDDVALMIASDDALDLKKAVHPEDGELAGPIALLFNAVKNPGKVEIPGDGEELFAAGVRRPDPDQEARMPNREVLPMLSRSRQNGVVASTFNTGIILQNDPRFAGKLRWSEMLQDVVVTADIDPMMPSLPVLRVQDRRIGDRFGMRHASLIRTIFDAPIASGGYGLAVQKSDLDTSVVNTASFHSVHPIREKLSSLVHDGKPRIDTLFIDYLGTADDAYHRTISRLFCVGAVARVFEPGCKFDFLPVIEGRQGLRKSTFVWTLSMGWATELQSGDLGKTEKLIEKLSGAWIAEVPELSAVSGASIESMKALISATHDKGRLAYKQYVEVYPRQSVFFGTVDRTEYLKDEAGNRRFWPLKAMVDTIDIERLRDEVEQIWAEAVVEYRKMREAHGTAPLPLYIEDKDVEAVANRLQESRREFGIEEELAGQIELALKTPQDMDVGMVRSGLWEAVLCEDGTAGMIPRVFCLRQVWTDILGREPEAYDGKAQNIVRSAIRRIPFVTPENVQVTFPGLGRQRSFRSTHQI